MISTDIGTCPRILTRILIQLIQLHHKFRVLGHQAQLEEWNIDTLFNIMPQQRKTVGVRSEDLRVHGLGLPWAVHPPNCLYPIRSTSCCVLVNGIIC